MKRVIFIILLLIVPFLVLAEDTCNQDDIKIESIVLDSTKGNVEETSNPNTDNNQVNLGLNMNVIDDSITYKLVITNTSNQDYTFDKNSLSTDYVNYDITYEDNSDIVKAGESKVIFLTVNYSSKPSVDKLSNGVLVDNPKVTFNLQKEEAQTVIEEAIKAIVNPETKDVIGFFLLILIISLIITIVLFKKSRKIKYTVMLILLILLTSNIVKAICTCTLNVNVNLVINAKEATFLAGNDVNIKMKQLAGGNLSTVTNGYSFKDEKIKAIKYSELEPSDNNKQEKNIVSTTESEYPIYMWYEDGTIYWWSEDVTPNLNNDSSFIFSNMNKLTDISGIKYFDSSNLINAFGMFMDDNLYTLDYLSNWNMSKVKIMKSIFASNEELVNIDGIKNWDVSSAENMGYIFNSCYSLEKADLSNWHTSSATDMQNMFGMWVNKNPYIDSKLTTIILSENFDTSKVTNMYAMFANNTKIEDYSFLQFLDTSSVTNMGQMFQYNEKLINLDYMRNWDVSNVLNFNGMFIFANHIEDVSALNNWNINKNASFGSMFYNNLLYPTFTKIDGTWNNGTFVPTS